jgi:hypothetical protein
MLASGRNEISGVPFRPIRSLSAAEQNCFDLPIITRPDIVDLVYKVLFYRSNIDWLLSEFT